MFNFSEDGLACSGPDKWFRFGVINLDEGIDFLGEMEGSKNPLVEPGCIGGRIMDMKPWSRS